MSEYFNVIQSRQLRHLIDQLIALNVIDGL